MTRCRKVGKNDRVPGRRRGKERKGRRKEGEKKGRGEEGRGRRKEGRRKKDGPGPVMISDTLCPAAVF